MRKFWAWLQHWLQWDPGREVPAAPHAEPAIIEENSDTDAPGWLKEAGVPR